VMAEQMRQGFGFGGRRGADRPTRPQRPE
jgi:hypothetical protein